MRSIFRVFLLLFAGAIIGLIVHRVIMTPGTYSIANKLVPDWNGVDPKIQPFVDDYKVLAKKNGINFIHEVTIGFTDIKYKDVVGVCYYGYTFREIDVDKKYWKESSERTRRTLLYHELTHCYCLRSHDYGKDEKYPEPKDTSYSKTEVPKRRRPPYDDVFFISPGFMIDGCPLSVMYPYVLNDECAEKHAEHYENEMFDRCQPY